MTDGNWFSFVGIAIDIVGAALVGIPIFSKSLDHIVKVESTAYTGSTMQDAKKVYFALTEQKLVRVGLLLLVLGFLLQLVGLVFRDDWPAIFISSFIFLFSVCIALIIMHIQEGKHFLAIYLFNSRFCSPKRKFSLPANMSYGEFGKCMNVMHHGHEGAIEKWVPQYDIARQIIELHDAQVTRGQSELSEKEA